ncbi:hypothetical protein [Mucilaginibacter ginsenosidivorans]|uniref:Uncharacterized protein n=1 Tax=Mucilaginibacter ginsenosidivorans TaxID=398053 RepID=A0A5B8UVI6_9SPHI|nr:hypothetical protein [Mucilaginibacter ginsenosidivorans]QEC62456.1 hypothetical protein FRZ54_07600 [Mucilaginibacter ginsenosidivorans]
MADPAGGPGYALQSASQDFHCYPYQGFSQTVASPHTNRFTHSFRKAPLIHAAVFPLHGKSLPAVCPRLPEFDSTLPLSQANSLSGRQALAFAPNAALRGPFNCRQRHSLFQKKEKKAAKVVPL